MVEEVVWSMGLSEVLAKKPRIGEGAASPGTSF